jgi:hypothetical protein
MTDAKDGEKGSAVQGLPEEAAQSGQRRVNE